jgi:hypothetical protein
MVSTTAGRAVFTVFFTIFRIFTDSSFTKPISTENPTVFWAGVWVFSEQEGLAYHIPTTWS